MLNRKLIFVSLVLCLVSRSGYVIGETVTDYLPLTDGNYWTYSVNGDLGSYQETVTVLQGTTTINGIPTKALRYSGGPYDQVVEYWTNDDEGIRLHGVDYPDSDAGPVSLTFDPPLVTANKVMNLHESVKTEGQVTFDFTNNGTFILDYVSSYTLEGTETVTVPAGVYETVKVTGSLLITGSLGGEPFRDEESSSTWSAEYIGDVKDENTDTNGTETAILVNTNVRPPLRFLPYLPLLLD